MVEHHELFWTGSRGDAEARRLLPVKRIRPCRPCIANALYLRMFKQCEAIGKAIKAYPNYSQLKA